MGGSVWMADHCHYCPRKAESVDHIVPRMLLPKPLSRLPAWFRTLNEIASCKRCNNDKGSKRGSCFCKGCVAAWVTAKNCGFIRELSTEERDYLVWLDGFYETYLEK